MMKAVRCTSGDKPGLGRYDVLVRVHAASLNHRDQAILDGEYGGPTQ
jgi:NADPH:quinone reductase-like Zn-dependent oxidoreductase